MVEYLSSKHEALGSVSSTEERRKMKDFFPLNISCTVKNQWLLGLFGPFVQCVTHLTFDSMLFGLFPEAL